MRDYERDYNLMDNMPEIDDTDDCRQFPVGPIPPMRAAYPQPPIVERPLERVVNRCMVHEVPHVCPINTRIINNHIFRHTYRPTYTCCEQNVISHVQEGSCCNFY